MTSRSPLNLWMHIVRGWSESTLYRWWIGAGRCPVDRMEEMPSLPAMVVLLWVLVGLAIS